MARPAPRAARKKGAPGPAGRLLLPPRENPAPPPPRPLRAAPRTCLSPALPLPAPPPPPPARRAAAEHGTSRAPAPLRTQPPRRHIAPALLLSHTLPARSH